MYFNNVFTKTFLLIICGISICAMDEKSLTSLDEDSPSLNEYTEIPELRKIAFSKANQVLNNLTLEDNLKWMLRNLPLDLEDEIKQELIKNNGAAWWYCFGDQAQNIDLHFDYIINEMESGYHNNCFALHQRVGKEIKFIIFDLAIGEMIVKGSVDTGSFEKYKNGRLDSLIKMEYIKETIKKKELKISEIYPFLVRVKKDNFLARGFTSLPRYRIEETKLDYFDFTLMQNTIRTKSGKIAFLSYYIPMKNINEPVLDIDKYILGLKSHYHNDHARLVLQGYHDTSATGENSRVKVKISNNKDIAITGSSDQTIKVWNLKTLKCVYGIEGECSQENFQLSSDDTFVLTKSDDNTAVLFDTKTAKQIQVFPATSGFSRATQEINYLSISGLNNVIAICSTCDNGTQIKILRIDSIINDFSICQLLLIKLLYAQYNINGFAEIRSNSIWNQILKSFNNDIQQLIFEKFNLRITCS